MAVRLLDFEQLGVLAMLHLAQVVGHMTVGSVDDGDFCQLVVVDVDSKADLWVTVCLGTFPSP